MDDENSQLFETETRKGGRKHKVFAATVLVCILWIWVYRATQLPPSKATTNDAFNGGRTWYWIGMFVSEILLGKNQMDDENSRLFETETRKGGRTHKIFAATVLDVVLDWDVRVRNIVGFVLDVNSIGSMESNLPENL
ncbi:cellulose synthase like E1 [Artemisia annua]|uniref:Cellulose synthase like E1 n=1 Tax=Artemisia annua TaxID=35608 RepID=A0A2U1M1B5_ARTAN|nr:cellulose synthase like E1 [Artemisia annua]